MADDVVFGVEQELCPAGCEHTVGIHSRSVPGCSRTGAGGWCLCLWYPDRIRAARLLEESVAAPYLFIKTPERSG